MKKQTIVREVYRSNWNGMDCMMIADPDGEIDRAYPCHVRPRRTTRLLRHARAQRRVLPLYRPAAKPRRQDYLPPVKGELL